MKHGARSSKDNRSLTNYWMRTVSFTGLHRILKATAGFPSGVTAGQLNKLVQDNGISLTQRSSPPSPTTLYHYRNTLLHLGALKRNGRILYVNRDDADVCKLLTQPTPADRERSLCDDATEPFASLVLKNRECQTLFFELFMPADTTSISVSDFREKGASVKWTRFRTADAMEVVFKNDKTGRTSRCTSRTSVTAVLYGLRYWARDELKLIDEYTQRSDGNTVMFPVFPPTAFATGIDSAVLETVRSLLSLRTAGDWTLLSVPDLIVRFCEVRRRPISLLFRAIDWLRHEWPNHTVPIPTSRALATLTATSSSRDSLELRRYYRLSNGPYVSHIRIHKNITTRPVEPVDHEHVHA